MSKDIPWLQSKRPRITQLSSIDHAVQLIQKSSNILFICGAGISSGCGIPDFRSKGGVYDTMLSKGLKNPEDLFALRSLRLHPNIFYENCSSLLPSRFHPGPTHMFLSRLANINKTLRIYTQNLDMLENKSGVPEDKIVYCHGCMDKCHCLRCNFTAPLSAIESNMVNGTVPVCPACRARGEAARADPPPEEKDVKWVDENFNDIPFLPLPAILRPDVVFFGENLPPIVFERKKEDFPKADLVIVMGTSCAVAPVRYWIEAEFPPNVPQILINNERVGPLNHFDICLIGSADVVCYELARRLGWADFVNLCAATRENYAPAPSSTSTAPAARAAAAASVYTFVPFVKPGPIRCVFEEPNTTRVEEEKA